MAAGGSRSATARHGVKEVVAERFARELPHLQALPTTRFDTAYRERRVVGVGRLHRGNRYSVPGELCGALVEVRIALDGGLAIYNGEDQLVARQAGRCGPHWLPPPRARTSAQHQSGQDHDYAATRAPERR